MGTKSLKALRGYWASNRGSNRGIRGSNRGSKGSRQTPEALVPLHLLLIFSSLPSLSPLLFDFLKPKSGPSDEVYRHYGVTLPPRVSDLFRARVRRIPEFGAEMRERVCVCFHDFPPSTNLRLMKRFLRVPGCNLCSQLLLGGAAHWIAESQPIRDTCPTAERKYETERRVFQHHYSNSWVRI